MKLSEFFDKVLPEDGVHIVAHKVDRTVRGRTFSQVTHTPCNNTADMVNTVKAKAASKNEVYYALASYKQAFHLNSKGKTVIRTRNNIDKLKSLWFDIDFKDGYAGPKEVVVALRAFCKAINFPAPSILVNSGNGIHAYWPLTTAISYDRWQVLANNLKTHAKDNGLKADLVCTADGARILRPPGTRNWKDKSNPKPVVFLYTSETTHDPDKLEHALGASQHATHGGDELGPVPSHIQQLAVSIKQDDSGRYGEAGSSTTGLKADTYFSTIERKCGVVAHHVTVRGADASEPEWTAMLQLLKFCSDSEIYLHEISDGHPDYTPEATNEKFQQRVENEAGPTTCEFFSQFRGDICGSCPHNFKIKSPITLGEELAAAAVPAGQTAVSGSGVTLYGWRCIQNNGGMEHKVFDPKTGEWEWQKVLERVWELTRVTRTTADKSYTLRLTARYAKAGDIVIDMPAQFLGSAPDMRKLLADKGAPLLSNEVNHFGKLMTTWLSELQSARDVEDTTDQLGWIRSGDEANEIIGFSAGSTAFYTDGTKREDVRIKREFEPVGRAYSTRGELKPWQDVADFLCEQDNPALTATLASAFAAPLVTFTGVPGGILSVVSQESARGKTSTLKAAQAVWGSPTLGMNSVDDTRLSVVSKLAFLNNLPAYWDELRGKQTMENFLTLAFQVSQGKEKTRLDSSANMREVHTWETLLVAASNESIFDNMGMYSAGSDAGVARTFELDVEMRPSLLGPAAIQALFADLNGNYGHAGLVYAEYLADNHASVKERVLETLTKLSGKVKAKPQERFWLSIAATLIVGAQISNSLGLTKIKLDSLLNYLVQTIYALRSRSDESMSGSSNEELIAAYVQQHADKALIMQNLPVPRAGAPSEEPVAVISPPKADRIIYVVGREESRMICLRTDFVNWLRTSRHMSASKLITKMKAEKKLSEAKMVLGKGTKWALPRASCLVINLDYVSGEINDKTSSA